MSEINGVFIYNGRPQNGATAKLWQLSVFGGTPPAQDDAEPGSGQQGSSITTGVACGGGGAFRFTSVPAGEYYVSVEYDNHRAWLYAQSEILGSILTTQGDMLVRGASSLERIAIGSNGQVFTIVGGVPAWADPPLTLTEEESPSEFRGSVTSAYVTKFTATIPATGIAIFAWLTFTPNTASGTFYTRILYNSVEKASASGTEMEHVYACQWEGAGLGTEYDIEIQYKHSVGGENLAAIAGCWYVSTS